MQEEKKKIVFVCTGNTCRSPMAEAVFRYELRRRKIEDATCFSAGISAKGNENINLKSVSVLIENGFSVENFHPRNLDLEILRSAYVIVCMTEEQRDHVMDIRWKILREAGEEEIKNNVYAFSDICGYDIPDPYGGDLELYRKTFSQINNAMPSLFERFFAKEEEKTAPPKKKRGRPRKYPEGQQPSKGATKTGTKRRKKSERLVKVEKV